MVRKLMYISSDDYERVACILCILRIRFLVCENSSNEIADRIFLYVTLSTIVLKTDCAVESGDCFHENGYYENLKICKIFEIKNLLATSLKRKYEETNFSTNSQTWKEKVDD